ncbi:hypothetical protein [Bradyrhizobium sp. LHD-71]|uniref:hypothetical protein n=1 Tax=Bradyrhizobium sp. LHD-71 TaxID=3072141 RepID=UPI00280CB730|nr:hypothetical protein [Bradyrhizobium sp. LHD-71]MDQ8729777.1 hypothetical protein [Bradyrhizobium sp. LHD-71]
MIIRLEKLERGVPRGGRSPDVSSIESGMIAGDAHSLDPQSTVTPDRRLRNWILLANVLAWVAIIVAVRWLFF